MEGDYTTYQNEMLEKTKNGQTITSQQYIAHKNEFTGDVQTIKEHCENTAQLSGGFAVDELKEVAYIIGLFHDVGKYQFSFQQKMKGKKISVDHSTCGALAIKENYPKIEALSLLMEYCIAGHHGGIPDGGIGRESQLEERLKKRDELEDYSTYKKDLEIPIVDTNKFLKFLLRDIPSLKNKEGLQFLIEKYAFLTRYCFSCLVDADSIDTAEFCNGVKLKALVSDYQACLMKVKNKLNSFICQTELQKARSLIQNQVFQKRSIDSEIYLMNMPTGSGKTLCSIRFALERAIEKKKQRIIYVIPYNSIIDQTYMVFKNLFEDSAQMLRHQSTFSYESNEDLDEDYRNIAKKAIENWNGDFIITTMVQFFESIYSNKRGKLRKLHNMENSILIFDEAHLMPKEYLQPCLQGIAHITRYLHSEAIFLTATMPNFEKLFQQYTFLNSKILNLVTDRSLFSKFQTCQYHYLDRIRIEKLVEMSQESPSSLIIVNKKITAREIFKAYGSGKIYHLSKYMSSWDIEKKLQTIKEELSQLELDYPTLKNVPESRRIHIVSTSLIEAGVDLDMCTVFREVTGLDSILQSGGRCNREGKRNHGIVYIFKLENNNVQESLEEKIELTEGLLKKYSDITSYDCIDEYYERLFELNKKKIRHNAISERCEDIKLIPFREYAEEIFQLIDDKNISIVVPRNEESKEFVNCMEQKQYVNIRQLQKYTCSVSIWEWEDLKLQGVINDFGTGIYCLTNLDYYSDELGILFEAKDYIL